MRLKTSDVVCILSCDKQKQGGMHGHEEIQAGPTRDAQISPSDVGKAYHNLDAKERAKIAGGDCGAQIPAEKIVFTSYPADFISGIILVCIRFWKNC